MRTAGARIAEILGIETRVALLLMLGSLEILALVVTRATQLAFVPGLLLIAAIGLVVVAGFRWPLVPLLMFAALIPVEEMISLPGVGTLARLAGLAFAGAYALPRLGRLRLRAMPMAGFVYAGWAVLSYTWALSPSTARSALATFVQLFVIAVLVADVVVRRPTFVRPLLWTYSLSAATIAVVGILTYATEGIGDLGRIAAFAGQDANQYAALLLPALVFTMFEMTKGRLVPLAAVVALVTATAILVSGSRGAWVSAAVVTVLMVVPQLTPRRRVTALGAAVALVAVVLLIPGVADLVLNRVLLAVPTGGAGRTEIWSVGLQIFQTSPVVGVGYGNFPIAYTPEIVRASPIGEAATIFYQSGSHSILVGTLAELGAAGLLILGTLVLQLLRQRPYGEYGQAVRAMLTAMMISALFLDVLNRKQVWLLIGIAAGLAFLQAREQAARLAHEARAEPEPAT